MSDFSVNITLYHHGYFAKPPSVAYIIGNVDVIEDIDPDLFTFWDLEDYAKQYGYDPGCKVYFKADGHSFKNGFRLLFDDASVMDMINLCLPFGLIELYVDHSTENSPVDVSKTQHQVSDYDNDEQLGKNDYMYLGTDAENEDSDYVGSDEEYSDTESDDTLLSEDEDFQISDEELVECRQVYKSVKEHMANGTQGEFKGNEDIDSDESAFNSDELRSVNSSSEDENSKIGYVGPPIKKKLKCKLSRVYNPKDNKNESMKWEVGMTFASIAEFRDVVRLYGINERRAVKFATNDKIRCKVVCEDKCPFYIWCSKIGGSDKVKIKTLRNEHLCTKPYKNKLVSVKYLTEIYGDRIRVNPQWKVKEMVEVIGKELEVEVPKIKVLRVRRAALEGVHETLKAMYSRVRDFGHELLLNNPRNKVDIRTTRLNEEDPNKFKRMYICYDSLKLGWKLGCRPVLGVDGCFLKTVCGGQLLSAVGRDGNNQMFPVAYAVVETENSDSWRWFTGLLRDDLELGDGTGFTIISDQQKGLDNALKEILPKVEHRLCTRHIYSNFRKRFPSEILRRQFWNAACATYTSAFERAMKAIERQNKTAHEHLRKFSPKLWSKSHFLTISMADNVENNMSECFNAWIISERYLPLLTMMQEIHHKLMLRIRQKRDEILSNDYQVCPRIMKKVNQVVTASRDWRASWDGERKYVVKQGTRAVTVDLLARTCDCRVFELTGIPCCHAVAAIHDSRQQPLDFVSEYYKRDKYLETYKYSLRALRGQDYWQVHSTDEMLPPDIPAKLRGRPKKLRRREEWEGGSRSRSSQPSQQGSNIQRFNSRRIMHCSICGKTGHRKNKCTGNARAQQGGEEGGQGSGQNREQNDGENREEIGGQTKHPITIHRPKLAVRRKVATVEKNQS